MKEFTLATPSIEFKESYLRALKEFQGEGRNLDENISRLENDFSSLTKRLQDEAEGKNLKEGYVPQTTYWGIELGEYIGRISIRHALNENLLKVGGHIGYEVRPSRRKMGFGKKMLKMVLPKAQELGITKALITCDSTNVASRKIIESCGGVLENEVQREDGKPSKLRFWLVLD